MENSKQYTNCTIYYVCTLALLLFVTNKYFSIKDAYHKAETDKVWYCTHYHKLKRDAIRYQNEIEKLNDELIEIQYEK